MTADPRFDGAGPDAAWWESLRQGTLSVQLCGSCRAYLFPPGLVCRSCGGADLALVPASGRGTVYSTTTVRSRDGDYDVSIVELEEGPRLMSRVEGIAPDAVRIGQPVIARVRDGDEPLLVFEPRPEGT